MKLAFVSAHPAPYRDPFLRRLAKVSSFETKIFSLFDDDNGHAFWNLEAHGYESELIGRRSEHWLRLFGRLLMRVILGGYDVICWPGFHRPCTKLAMIVCAVLGKRYGFCADSIMQPPRGGLALMIKRFVIRRSSFIFVPGQASRDFFVRTFNYPIDRICLGQYALEGDEIEQRVKEGRGGVGENLRDWGGDCRERSEVECRLRERHGFKQNDIIFLMVANMLKTRHYPITAAAFCRFAEKRPQMKFVMVGKGEDLDLMRERAKGNPSLVVIPGVSFAEMQELYAIADVYVHGGTEPASTALVIGAIAHLPVMSSPAVGCTADVVRDGETGVLVSDYLSEDEWMNAFERMWTHKDHWQAWGETARNLSRGLDCANVVEKFVELVRG